MYVPLFISDGYEPHYDSGPKCRYTEHLVENKFRKDVILTFKLKDERKPKGFWKSLFAPNRRETISIGFAMPTVDVENITDDVTAKDALKDALKENGGFTRVCGSFMSFISSFNHHHLDDVDVDIIVSDYDFVNLDDCGFTTYWKRGSSRRGVYD